jgi:hypothetical protein
MSTVAPISEPTAEPRGNKISSSYLLPDERCATCDCKTRGTLHPDCKRDPQGRLLVKRESA